MRPEKTTRYMDLIWDCSSRRGKYSAGEICKKHGITVAASTMMNRMGWTTVSRGTRWTAAKPKSAAECREMARELISRTEAYHSAGKTDTVLYRKLIDELPDVFSKAEGLAIAARLGVPERTFSRWVRKGGFVKMRHGVWAKPGARASEKQMELRIDDMDARTKPTVKAPPVQVQFVDTGAKPIRIKIGPIEIRW